MAIRGNQQRFVGLPGPRSLTNGQNSGDVRGTHQAPGPPTAGKEKIDMKIMLWERDMMSR